jgi:hypothetical protein
VQSPGGDQTSHTAITVTINFPDGASAVAAVHAPDQACWTESDAKEFVWAVWRLLKAHGSESLQLRELDPAGIFRLEFVADSGSVVTKPLVAPRAVDFSPSQEHHSASRWTNSLFGGLLSHLLLGASPHLWCPTKVRVNC